MTMHLRHANHATLGTGPTLYKRVGSVIPRVFGCTTLPNVVIVFYPVIKLHEFIDSYHYRTRSRNVIVYLMMVVL